MIVIMEPKIGGCSRRKCCDFDAFRGRRKEEEEKKKKYK